MRSVPRTDPEQWERRVLATFLVEGRLRQIPARRKKRLVVLRWLADHFRPGERYPEAQVNEILGRYHEDVASLRRWLVDEELMRRQAGLYWRMGTLPLLRPGNDFRAAVMAVIMALRPGELASYGEVAMRAGYPGAARAAGRVLATTSNLPWWRVVRADGALAAGDTTRQAELLRAEGVEVRDGRVANAGLRGRLAPDAGGAPPAAPPPVVGEEA
jgi:alkylated DNA nucleotide flippase Atl1